MPSWNVSRLVINGLEQEVRFSEEATKGVFLPLLERLSGIANTSGGRAVCFFAGPPGVGKSTLTLFLEHLSRENPGLVPAQALGLDGFHHTNAWLDAHVTERDGREVSVRSVKGAPESFDVESFRRTCEELHEQGRLSWPLYSRELHEPVPDAVDVTERVALVEGNWLLLDDPAWEAARAYADLTVMVRADEQMLRERLVGRKVQGGLSRKEAEAWYDRVDGVNVSWVLHRSVPADVTILMAPDGDYALA